jgi:hypothetical protein
LFSVMTDWHWLALFALGAYHGLNPAMGWLFAVALGLQEKSRLAVFRSIAPLGLGHVISVGLAVLVVQLARGALPQRSLQIATAVLLIGFGLYRLIRSHHFRWVGMRVGPRDLVVWSFLMSSAHGAGLMLAPIILGLPAPSHQEHAHPMQMAATNPSAGGLSSAGIVLPVAAHSLGYLLVTCALAFLVYEKLGVAVLRRAWLNLDLLWAGALIGIGLFSLVIILI